MLNSLRSGGEIDHSFWAFSLRTYGREGVAQTCLQLQDEGGADVNLVLLSLWLALERGVLLTVSDAEAAVADTAAWRERVVKPLREARVASKSTFPLDAGEQRFRAALKAVELEAERIEQTFLYRWAAKRWPAERAADGEASAARNAHVLLVANCGPGFAQAMRESTDSLARLAAEPR